MKRHAKCKEISQCLNIILNYNQQIITAFLKTMIMTLKKIPLKQNVNIVMEDIILRKMNQIIPFNVKNVQKVLIKIASKITTS